MVDRAKAMADLKDEEVSRRTAEVEQIVRSLNEHASKNHIGERVNASLTANLAALAARAKEA